MDKFQSPKMLIVDYYDSLITRIDVYTEELLEKYTENDILPNENEKKQKHSSDEVDDEIESPYKCVEFENELNDLIKATPGSTKVREYVNQVRSKAIDEIKRVQEENLQRYELNKDKYKYHRNDLTEEKIEEMKRELFKERFCFLLKIDLIDYRNRSPCLFKLHTIVTDCYFESAYYFEENSTLTFKDTIAYIFGCRFWIFDSSLDVNLNNLFQNVFAKCMYDLFVSKSRESFYDRKYGKEVISFTKETFYKIQHINFGMKSYYKDIFYFDTTLPFSLSLTHLKSIEIHCESLAKRKPPFYKIKDKIEIKSLGTLENLEYLTIAKLKFNKEILDDVKGLNKLIMLKLTECKIPYRSLVLCPPRNLEILEINYLNFPVDFEDCSQSLKILKLSEVNDYNHLKNLNNDAIDLRINHHDGKNMKQFIENHNFSNLTVKEYQSFDDE